jgi:twitching motility protein PilI
MAESSSADILQLLGEIERRSRHNAGGMPQEQKGQQLWEGVLCTIAGIKVIAPLHEVREILNYPPAVTHVPGTKSWVRGIANIRGNLLPIIDLQVFLGGKPVVPGRRSRVLVINHHGLFAGLLVGNVQGMRYFAEDQHADVPVLPNAVQPFTKDAYVLDGEIWPVFSMNTLAENPGFQVAAA